MKNKDLTLERLKATREKMNTLRPKEFFYGSFVHRNDGECGTVCCIAGWYPKWFPASGLRWVRYGNNLLDLVGTSGVADNLMRYHEIGFHLCGTLFFGDSLKLKDGTFIPFTPDDAPLSVVKKLWDRIIKEIENENI